MCLIPAPLGSVRLGGHFHRGVDACMCKFIKNQ